LQFQGPQQNDANELLINLISAIHEDLNQYKRELLPTLAPKKQTAKKKEPESAESS